MQKELKEAIIEWDVKNWWRAIEFWNVENKDMEGKKVLDIGANRGGMSLFWALRGAEVVCSDVKTNSFDTARKLHAKFGVDKKITYKVIDATNMDYENEFDIITFKSVLGGVGYGNDLCMQKKMMDNIHKALKAGGYCFFVENLASSSLHKFAREKIKKRGTSWWYFELDEILKLTEKFRRRRYKTYGYIAAFARGNKGGLKIISNFFGTIDSIFDRFINEKKRYIVSCVLKK